MGKLQRKEAGHTEFVICDYTIELYYRVLGRGQPIIVLHGGPDFDHSYLLPDMDQFSDSYYLIYYDQRGRGKSGKEVQPEAVSIKTEIEDLEELRNYFQLDKVAILGHSWGGLLATEYAIRYPDRVSHLILMNTAPVSHEDYLLLQEEIRKRREPYRDELDALAANPQYREGEPEAVAAYYRIHYSTGIKRPEHLERVLASLNSSFTKEGILRGWKIEDRLVGETWAINEFDLIPELKGLNNPTLIIHGDYDFVPVKCAVRIAEAIPGARFALLSDCGHFAYIESPEAVREELRALFEGQIR